MVGILVGNIEKNIYRFRDKNVMLDSDLADLYGVETFNLNKAVKRNINRFPEDFMFQLTDEEFKNLKFQIGISSLYSIDVIMQTLNGMMIQHPPKKTTDRF